MVAGRPAPCREWELGCIHWRIMLAEIGIAGAVVCASAAVATYGSLAPESQLFGRTIVAGGDAAEFALTFDDGPNDPWTGRLLDVLARHQARATFFLIGKYVRARPELVREIRDAGHLIGNHTMTHPWLAVQSTARVREELAGCNAALEDVLGEKVRFFGRRMGRGVLPCCARRGNWGCRQ